MRASALLAFTLALALSAPAWPGSRPPVPYRVIVNAANPATTVDRAFLREAFLKKTIRWPHGETVRPVDLSPGSAVRGRFSAEVLGRSVAAVRAYWQQCIFSGRDVPPVELEDDAAVVRYVLRYPGAVGYVAGDTPAEGTKGLSLR